MLLLASVMALSAGIQEVSAPTSTYSDGVLVTSADVTTCPYQLVGVVSANMRFNPFERRTTEAMHEKLRKKARKLNADAVVLVTIGEGRVTALSWNSRPLTGRAIKYVDRACAPQS